MKKEKINILMTCSGGDLAPEYIMAMKASTRYDISVMAVDGNPNAIGKNFADKFSVVPLGHAENYIQTVLDLVKTHHIDLIIAGSDGEALSLSLNRDIFAKEKCTIACPPVEVLSQLSNKLLTYQILKESGISCADFMEASTLDQLQKATQEMHARHEEIVIKPAISRGGRNVFVIRRDIQGEQSYFGGRETHCSWDVFQTKYQKQIADLFPLVVMQRLFEPTYDIDVLGWEGRPINVIPRLRHNPAGIPFEGNTICMTPQLVSLGKAVCQAFKLSWLLDIDVMCTADGLPVVLEVNPRMSGSCPASVIAGVPLFDNIVALSRGEEPLRTEPQDGTVIFGYKALKRAV